MSAAGTDSAAWFVAGLLYFAVIGRKRLVYAPEEEFAIKYSRQSPDGDDRE